MLDALVLAKTSALCRRRIGSIMRPFLPPLLVLAAVSRLVLPTAAQAVLITVDFTVLGDPLDPAHAGQSAKGSFSFDSSIIPAGGGTVLSPTVASINFSWDSTTWTAANAGPWDFTFDQSGDLVGWFLGGDPTNVITIYTAASAPDDFWVRTLGDNFTYHDFGTEGDFYGGMLTSWSVASAPSVPEPGTLSLLGLGLLPLGLIRRRRK